MRTKIKINIKLLHDKKTRSKIKIEMTNHKKTFVVYLIELWLISLQSGSEDAQSRPTLCDPMDCSLSASSVHGIFQARVLEWVAISFSMGSSRPRD